MGMRRGRIGPDTEGLGGGGASEVMHGIGVHVEWMGWTGMGRDFDQARLKKGEDGKALVHNVFSRFLPVAASEELTS